MKPEVATVRKLAKALCREIPEGPGCVMDCKPLRSSCTYQNCRVMQEVKALLEKLGRT